MRTQATLEAACPPGELFAHVADLDRYVPWMPLVHRAERVDAGLHDMGLDDAGSDVAGLAWSVELRTRVGPLARSKRLRMVRIELVPDHRARFERRELDGRRHSPWVLTATVEPTATGSRLTMDLEYGGSLWTGGILERILDQEIQRGSQRLHELVSAEPRR